MNTTDFASIPTPRTDAMRSGGMFGHVLVPIADTRQLERELFLCEEALRYYHKQDNAIYATNPNLRAAKTLRTLAEVRKATK